MSDPIERAQELLALKPGDPIGIQRAALELLPDLLAQVAELQALLEQEKERTTGMVLLSKEEAERVGELQEALQLIADSDYTHIGQLKNVAARALPRQTKPEEGEG
jgi:hypothetical protein